MCSCLQAYAGTRTPASTAGGMAYGSVISIGMHTPYTYSTVYDIQ